MGVALGSVGLAIAGPLVSTLTLGRTGAVPSLRWLGLTSAVWIAAVGLAWAVAPGPAARRLTPLALLAALAPLLAAAYADDSAYHLLRMDAASVLIMAALLLCLGAAWHTMRLPDRLASTAPDGEPEPARSPAVLGPVAGLALMLGVNDALFEPLGTYGVEYGAWLARGAVVVVPALVVAVLLRATRVRLEPVAALAALASAATAAAGWVGAGPGAMVTPALAVGALPVLVDGRCWHALSPGGRWLVGALTAIGFAGAVTLPDRFGVAAREVASLVPGLVERVPLAGIGLLALGLAARAALGAPRAPSGHTSRSAAMGGMRAA